MNINQLARVTGTSEGAIRHYSQVGLLPDTPVDGRSNYSESDVHAIKLINMALSVGLTFREILVVLSTNEFGDSSRRLQRSLQLLDRRRQSLCADNDSDREKRRIINVLEKELASLFA